MGCMHLIVYVYLLMYFKSSSILALALTHYTVKQENSGYERLAHETEYVQYDNSAKSTVYTIMTVH